MAGQVQQSRYDDRLANNVSVAEGTLIVCILRFCARVPARESRGWRLLEPIRRNGIVGSAVRDTHQMLKAKRRGDDCQSGFDETMRK